MRKTATQDTLPAIKQELLNDGYIPIALVTDPNNEIFREIAQQYELNELYGVIIYIEYQNLILA